MLNLPKDVMHKWYNKDFARFTIDDVVVEVFSNNDKYDIFVMYESGEEQNVGLTEQEAKTFIQQLTNKLLWRH